MSEEKRIKDMGYYARMAMRVLDDMRERELSFQGFVGHYVAEIEDLWDQAVETGKASEEDLETVKELYDIICTNYVWLMLGGED